MNRRLIATLLSVAGFAVTAPSFAGPRIDRIEVSAQPATAGKPVKITVHAQDVDDSVCAVQVSFGDGTKDEPQKTGGKFQKFPRSWEHTYAKAGKYTIVAEGARAGAVFGCVATAKFDLSVEAAPATAKGSSDAKASPCPEGWSLKGKAKKDGSFTCTPAKGAKDAKMPDTLACPAGTEYFRKGKTLGCSK